jgi:beta-glucanase (GH16 family)
VDTNWLLVWSDEFDGEVGDLPDPSVWTPDIGGDGWGNNQLEFNTSRAENASMDGDGNLAIVARREAYEGNSYTSARITTSGGVEFLYGRIEARMKMPVGAGIWPAFWMLGNNFGDVGWPDCGEIDILEYRGQQPAITLGTVHGPGYSGGQGVSETISVAGGGLHNDFHVFAIEWEANEIRWFVDDLHFHTVTPDTIPAGTSWVFDHPFFLILNVAVGGSFVGPVGSDTEFPQTLLVDYVRVYERGE